MKRILFSIIASFTIFAQFAFSQKASSINNQDYSKASVAIRFFDRTMYYPGSKEDNPIYVDVSITNKGTDTLRFKLAELFYLEPVEALPADKLIARHNAGGLYIEFFKGFEHLVGAVAHSVEHYGLAAVFKRLPYALLLFY